MTIHIFFIISHDVLWKHAQSRLCIHRHETWSDLGIFLKKSMNQLAFTSLFSEFQMLEIPVPSFNCILMRCINFKVAANITKSLQNAR